MVGTEKPASGYDKRTMANDIRALLQHLEIEKVSMIGHDRGARVATRFAKDHPAMLDRLVVMDNIPTRIIFQRMNAEVARGHWFFIFNNVPDLPEALMSEREKYGSATSFVFPTVFSMLFSHWLARNLHWLKTSTFGNVKHPVPTYGRYDTSFSKFYSVPLKGIDTRNIPRHLVMILLNIGSLRL